MHRGVALLFAIPLGAWPAPAEALQVEVRREVDFYDVRGTTGDEVLESLLAAPPRHEGRRSWGYTSTSVRWRFRWARSGRFCRITDARIRLDVEITLPRWRDRERAEPALRVRWDGMVASLREHEEGHAEIAERGARRVHRELLGTADACRGIEETANRVARRAWSRTRPEQERYDEETRRGRTQGVVWSGRAPATPAPEPPAAGREPPPAERWSIPAEGPGQFLELPERRRTVRLDRWTDRCPVLPWSGARGAPSGRMLAATCEPLGGRELDRAAGERWWAGLYRWRFVYGVEPDHPAPGGGLVPDTLTELELVVLAEEGGDRGRPVWHDRVDVRTVTVELPTIVRRPEGDFLELRYCLSAGRGCRSELYRLGGAGAEGWAYVRPDSREGRESELPDTPPRP